MALGGLVAAGGLAAFLGAKALMLPLPTISSREPGADGAPAERSRKGAGITSPRAIQTSFIAFSPSDAQPLPGEWTGFRGTNRDGIASETPTLSDLSEGNAPVLWKVSLGEGHAGPAVWEGRVYVLDYLELEKADALRCFSLSDGRELWRRSYPNDLKRNHGFSRTVPAISAGRVLSLGPAGQAMCVDGRSGELIWFRDVVAEYEGAPPLWYSGQCPLVDGDTAVIATAGRALLVGIDMATGKTLWESPNPDGWAMSHSSVMRYDLSGTPAYLYAALGGLACVSAEPERAGELLFSNHEWQVQVIAPSPILAGSGRLFLTAGYGAGSALFRIDQWGASLIWARGPSEGLACEQQSPIFYRGCLYGVMPKDAGQLNGQLVCQTADGRILWSSGKESRFGIGPYLLADGKIYVLDDEGDLYAIEAGDRAYRPLGMASIMGGQGVDAWAPMALAGTRLLLRDSRTMFCVELGEDD